MKTRTKNRTWAMDLPCEISELDPRSPSLTQHPNAPEWHTYRTIVERRTYTEDPRIVGEGEFVEILESWDSVEDYVAEYGDDDGLWTVYHGADAVGRYPAEAAAK